MPLWRRLLLGMGTMSQNPSITQGSKSALQGMAKPQDPGFRSSVRSEGWGGPAAGAAAMGGGGGTNWGALLGALGSLGGGGGQDQGPSKAVQMMQSATSPLEGLRVQPGAQMQGPDAGMQLFSMLLSRMLGPSMGVL
jgi:hypothetical protein